MGQYVTHIYRLTFYSTIIRAVRIILNVSRPTLILPLFHLHIYLRKLITKIVSCIFFCTGSVLANSLKLPILLLLINNITIILPGEEIIFFIPTQEQCLPTNMLEVMEYLYEIPLSIILEMPPILINLEKLRKRRPCRNRISKPRPRRGQTWCRMDTRMGSIHVQAKGKNLL